VGKEGDWLGRRHEGEQGGWREQEEERGRSGCRGCKSSGVERRHLQLGDDTVDCEGEGEGADEGTFNVDTVEAMAVAATEGRRKRRHHRSSSLSSEDDNEDEGK